jgi:hypothetical protein
VSDLVDVIRARNTLYERIGRDAVEMKLAVADKALFIDHLKNVRVMRGKEELAGQLEPSFFCGMTVRFSERMIPGFIAFTDRKGHVIGFVRLVLDNPPGEPPKGLMRNPGVTP